MLIVGITGCPLWAWAGGCGRVNMVAKTGEIILSKILSTRKRSLGWGPTAASRKISPLLVK